MKKLIHIIFLLPLFTSAQSLDFISPDDLNKGGGIFRAHLEQSGNLSTIQKIRLGPTHVNTFSNWTSGASYSPGDNRYWPIGSKIEWKCRYAVTSTTSPDLDTANWSLSVAFEKLSFAGMDGPDSTWFSTSLQRSTDSQEPDWVKLHGFSKGKIVDANFNYGSSNYTNGGVSTTSSTSFTIPSAGSSQTLTIGTGLSIPNSTSIGSCSDNFAIPTAHPTLMTRNLPSGLNLNTGDKVTFYHSTSLFVFVVARYNNTTGVAYGFSLWNYGTGTFSSWTLKSEEFLYVYRTSDENFEHFIGLVQTYNSGTGSVNILCVDNVGSSTRTDWTIVSAFRGITPTSSQQVVLSSINYPLAAFAVGQATGTGVDHYSRTNSSGTGFTYIYTGGPAINSPPANVTIDTRSGSTISEVTTNVWSKIQFADVSNPHKFIAISVTSPSGLGSSTSPNLYAATSGGDPSFRNHFDYQYLNVTSNYGYNGDGQSVGEFVLKYRDNNYPGDFVVTWPKHSDHAENNLTRHWFVDGVEINATTFSGSLNPYLLFFRPLSNNAYVTQTGTMISDARAGKFSDYTSTHSLDKYGLKYNMKITWSRDIFLDQGYNNMNELDPAWYVGTTAANSEVQLRPADGVRTEMTDTFKGWKSYLHKGSDNISVSQYFINQFGTWRPGLPNNGGGHIETGFGGSYCKMRPYPSYQRVVTAGTVEYFDGWWYVGWKGGL